MWSTNSLFRSSCPPPPPYKNICIRHVFKIALKIYVVYLRALFSLHCSLYTCIEIHLHLYIRISFSVSPLISISSLSLTSPHISPHNSIYSISLFLTEHRVALLSAPPSVFGRYWLEMDCYWIQDGPLNKIIKESPAHRWAATPSLLCSVQDNF